MRVRLRAIDRLGIGDVARLRSSDPWVTVTALPLRAESTDIVTVATSGAPLVAPVKYAVEVQSAAFGGPDSIRG